MENRSRDPAIDRNILYFLDFVDKVKYTRFKIKEKREEGYSYQVQYLVYFNYSTNGKYSPKHTYFEIIFRKLKLFA